MGVAVVKFILFSNGVPIGNRCGMVYMKIKTKIGESSISGVVDRRSHLIDHQRPTRHAYYHDRNCWLSPNLAISDYAHDQRGSSHDCPMLYSNNVFLTALFNVSHLS